MRFFGGIACEGENKGKRDGENEGEREGNLGRCNSSDDSSGSDSYRIAIMAAVEGVVLIPASK